jgi:hypothetical protein
MLGVALQSETTVTGRFLGMLNDTNNNPIMIDGLLGDQYR